MEQKNKIKIYMRTFWLAAFTGAAALISCAQNNNQNLKMNTAKTSEIIVNCIELEKWRKKIK